MSPRTRGRSGCWTCKLRKKKCDESRPICTRCSALSIICHGYDSKPPWWNDPKDKERTLEDIKKQVRTSSRGTRHKTHRLKLAPRLLQTTTDDPRRPSDTLSHREAATLRAVTRDTQINIEDTPLIMHFLDTVFYLEFPAYQQGGGGRGWLLSLLLQFRSFYESAILISYYHLGKSGTRAEVDLLEETEAQSGLATLPARLQLMFYALYSDGPDWSSYLHLSISSVEAYHPSGSQDSIRPRNFEFLICAVAWLDTIAATTAGTLPRLQPHLGSQYTRQIAGCSADVLTEISRIAGIHVYTKTAIHLSGNHCTEAEKVVSDIRQNLRRLYSEDPDITATSLYAKAASVYLHLVLIGYDELEDLAGIVVEAKQIIGKLGKTLHAIVWPLLMIGSVAEDQQFFRDVFLKLSSAQPALQHRKRILQVLECIWSHRRAETSFTWSDSLQMLSNVLLI